MRKGWLVVSAYLKAQKYDEIYEYLVEAAKKRECELIIVTNRDILVNFDNMEKEQIEFAIFWDKDIKAARYLEKKGVKIFNSASAIEICDDKSLTYLALCDKGITVPKTIISPLTYGFEDGEDSFLSDAVKQLGFPFVIKENCGSFGAQVYLAHNMEEAQQIINKISGRGYILQEYIGHSPGRDIRINMVGDKPVAAMLRENKNDFRANITNGGQMSTYEPTKQQTDMARMVCRELKLDFAGVDIMFGENDEPVFCEVNSNAHFKNIYDCTGINVADYIVDYVLKSIDDKID